MLIIKIAIGRIDRKIHGHGENDGFVLYDFIFSNEVVFCKYTNFSVM